MNKSYRQGQILKLIGARHLHTQGDLARALRSIGVRATQVTLSRDIRELGLVKTAQGYAQGIAESAPAAPEIDGLLGESVTDIRLAQNLLVLRTPPGHANAVAVALDRAAWNGIAGTIAGDDTILVIAPDRKTASSLRQRLLKIVNR
ncbi:MAG: arginine repressor [Bryobacteraceae bacterium]